MAEVAWTQVPDEAATPVWDRDLFALEGASLDQSHRWGEHSRRLGWEVRRLTSRDAAGRPRAMAQLLCRTYGPGVRMVWCPGGPVGDLAECGEGLRRAVRRAFPGPAHYLRLNVHRPTRDEDGARLETQGWRRVRTKLRSGLTMRLPLDGDADRLSAGFSSNWRHNLRRSGKRGLTLRRWEHPEVGEVLALYRAMEVHKALRAQWAPEQLTSLFEAFGERLVTWRCDDVDGQPLALRGCIILHDRAWDMLAATSVEARKVYASHALFWELLRYCQDTGVCEYDLRGVEPDKHPGVYEFKKGTGAALVEFLGEWDWASNGLLRWGADHAVRRQRAAD